MKLADLVMEKFKVEYDGIVFFRHRPDDAEIVLDCGATIQDWTACQPKKVEYDYRKTGETRTKIIVVLVGLRIHDVYQVGGSETEKCCSREELSSPELNQSYDERIRKLGRRKGMKSETAFCVTLDPVLPTNNANPIKDKLITGWPEKCTMLNSTNEEFFNIKFQ